MLLNNELSKLQSDPFYPNGLSEGHWERLLPGIRPAFFQLPMGIHFTLGEKVDIFLLQTSTAQNKAGVP